MAMISLEEIEHSTRVMIHQVEQNLANALWGVEDDPKDVVALLPTTMSLAGHKLWCEFGADSQTIAYSIRHLSPNGEMEELDAQMTDVTCCDETMVDYIIKYFASKGLVF